MGKLTPKCDNQPPLIRTVSVAEDGSPQNVVAWPRNALPYDLAEDGIKLWKTNEDWHMLGVITPQILSGRKRPARAHGAPNSSNFARQTRRTSGVISRAMAGPPCIKEATSEVEPSLAATLRERLEFRQYRPSRGSNERGGPSLGDGATGALGDDPELESPRGNNSHKRQCERADDQSANAKPKVRDVFIGGPRSAHSGTSSSGSLTSPSTMERKR